MRKNSILRFLSLAIVLSFISGCTVSSKQSVETIKDETESSVSEIQNESVDREIKLFAGNGFTYCIDESGRLYGWGRNHNGSLGLEEDVVISEPMEIPMPEKIVDVVLGSIMVALSENGNMYSWGVAAFGSESTERVITTTPEQITMPEKIDRLFDGHGAVGLAQGVSGTTYIWGWNLQGLLANGKTEHSMEPIVLDIPSRVVDISCYDTHVIALCEDGKVYTWGSNYFGELGDNSEIDTSQGLVERNRLKPDVVQLDDHIVSVAAGRGASYALSQNGEVYAWGANDVGQLGIGSGVEYASSPQKIPFDKKIKFLIAGAFHTYAITEEGELWAWGYNGRDYENMSVLGIGSYEKVVYEPVLISIENSIEYVTAGTVHTFAVTEDGSVWSWGENSSHAASFDTNNNVDVPTRWNELRFSLPPNP